MSKTTKQHVEELIVKAASAQDSGDAMRFSQAALNAANSFFAPFCAATSEDQIKHMVNRFLAWKLPQDFKPDNGISVREGGWSRGFEPTGTNLLDATQATAMVRHMIEGLPAS